MIAVICKVIAFLCSAGYAAYICCMDKIVAYNIILVFVIGIAGYLLSNAIFFLFSYLVSLPIGTKKEYDTYNRFYGRLFGLILEHASYLAGARVEVIGLDKLPDENFLIVSNHLSNFDPMITAGVLRKYPLSYITKPGNYKIPIGRRYMRRCGYLKLDREDIRSGAMVTKKAADYIKSKEFSVGVYPEGTRNKSGEGLLDFKPGCFKTALWAKCPLVVMSIKNTNMIHKNFPFKRTKVTLEILRTIGYDELQGMNTGEISELARYIIDKSISA